MDTEPESWWKKHGLTIALLLSAFGLALLVRIVFMASLIQQFGPLYLYGGGSDSFYHSRVMVYIIQNHGNLVRDYLLNYPVGAVNPREPLFDWMNALLGMIFAPLFGGSAIAASAWFLDLAGPLWSALGVFPIYLIGKEVTSKRAGIVAAFLYPMMVANIDSSTFGYGNYLSFYAFFILVTVYGFLRMIRATGSRRWVESYTKPRQIPGALRSFARVERASVKWAVFTGVSFGTLALAWQGYSFAVAAMVVFLLFALIVERIRKIDSFGLYVNMWIVGLVGFPMAVPYYVPQGLFAGWFDLPLLVFFGALLIALPFVMLRDVPWVVSVPVLAGIGAIAIGVLDVVNHNFFVNIVTGQGYFVKTLVYSTVAEAQAPSIDALILGYGVVTFFLAFVGLALLILRMARSRFPRRLMFFLVFGVFSIYLPISAAKFFYLGSAGFALLAAEPIVQFLDVARYPELRRTVGQLSDRRGQATALRRSFKPRHVLIMALVLVIVLPNVWYALDAGIPYNAKGQYGQQIYDTLPPFLRTAPQNATSFYLGAAGTQLDTPNQYDEAGYNWLASQDQNLPAPQRPGFISWWDYGFQAVSQGFHPTVADNFQNGIDPAGNFLLSQNESLAIGILATDLLVSEARYSGQPYLPYALNQVLASDGLDIPTLQNLLVNQSYDVALVLAHPDRYLAVDPNNLDGTNAMYDAVSYYLASTLPESGVANVYNDLQTFTHWSIRYAMVDNRLFPFTGSNTGIFYAPADLTDRVIGAGGAPTSYYTLTALGSDGTTYPVGSVPAGVAVVNYNINWLQPFYNSMIYRVFIGYSGADIGSSGIPGLSGNVLNDPIEPGWMMQHFQVVYRTAYYCPFASPTGHPGCFSAMNLPDAVELSKSQNGTVDSSAGSYFNGGETMLEYYAGQTMTGLVSLPNGAPVSDARVTVFDSWGIPHMTTTTSATGAYTIVLPPGNDTLNVTLGAVDGRTQEGNTVLLTTHLNVPEAIAGTPGAPTLVQNFVLKPATVQGFIYWNTANNSSYQPVIDQLVAGATVVLYGGGLTTRTTTTDASGSYVLANVAPGAYNMSILFHGGNFSQPQVYLGAGASSNQTRGLTAATVTGFVQLPSGAPGAGATVEVVASATGTVVGSIQANASGAYSIPNLGVGNYTVTASIPTISMQSPPSAFGIVTAGAHVKSNLTLALVFHVDVALVANGAPAGGIPVRFSPLTLLKPLQTPQPGPNGTGPGPTGPPSGSPATKNSSVFFTDANGFVSAILPVGNYSVYALGYVGSTLYVGLTNAFATTNASSLSLPTLTLSSANLLHGSVIGGTGSALALPTEILAYDAQGNVAAAFLNGTGTYALELPSGSYTVLAAQGLTVANSQISAALTRVTVSGDTMLPLSLTPGLSLTTVVGTPICCTSNSLYPSGGARVQITLNPGGATETTYAEPDGNASFIFPASVAAGGTYCLTATSTGYAPYSVCGLTPVALQSSIEVPLILNTSVVNVTIAGLPNGASFTLNLTASSPTAGTETVTGTGPFFVTLRPGTYTVTGWARSSSGGLILPTGSVSLSVPLASGPVSLTLPVARQVSVTGRLVLPSGLDPSLVILHLSSPTQNLTVSGSAFLNHFLASPGTYTAYGVAQGANLSYVSLGTWSIDATGVPSGPIDMTQVGTRLIANLTRATDTLLGGNFTVQVIGPGGLIIPGSAVSGQVTVVVPSNATYEFAIATTQLVPQTNGATYASFVVSPGYACAVGEGTAFCTVPLIGSSVLSSLSGTLVYPGFPTPLNGLVELLGPGSSPDVVSDTVTNGSFSLPLLPGGYTLYASSGGPTAPVANVSRVTVGPTPGAPITVRLAPTWTDYLTLTPPLGGVLGDATVTVTAPTGTVLKLYDQLFNSAIPLIVPAGVYTVSASAPASPYGVPLNATASQSIALTVGNAATTLSLSYALTQTASLMVVGPSTVALGNGGTASFAFALTNTGNAPENLHLVGSPSTWNITFVPQNVTLGTIGGNRTVSGEVTIVVPTGTPVAHPTITLQALLGSGVVAATAFPTPNVALTPSYGLRIGQAIASGVTLSPYSITTNVFVLNTGTVGEVVRLGIADAARLSGLGWTAKILEGKGTITAPVTLAVGSNTSFAISLSAPPGEALPPGTVTVTATLSNSSAVSGSVTVTIPANAISLNQTGLIVTGPSIGTPPAYPDWFIPLLCFLPAIGVVIFLGVRRYLKTRRWSRR